MMIQRYRRAFSPLSRFSRHRLKFARSGSRWCYFIRKSGSTGSSRITHTFCSFLTWVKLTAWIFNGRKRRFPARAVRDARDLLRQAARAAGADRQIHFMSESLTYSVPLLLRRRCDRTLDADGRRRGRWRRALRAVGHAVAGPALV